MRDISKFFGIMISIGVTSFLNILLGAPTLSSTMSLFWAGVIVCGAVIFEFMAFAFIATHIYDFLYDEEDHNQKIAKALAREETERMIRKVIKEECEK